MLSSKLRDFFLHSRIPCYDTVRYLRGGTTIRIRPEKPKTRESVKEDQRRHKELRKSYLGASRTLHLVNEQHSRLGKRGDLDLEFNEEAFEKINLHDIDVKEQFDDFYQESKSDLTRKAFYNVKRKYFKGPKLPNMVTYVEKQDMKILHANDPETWDFEKLAERFPVTPQIAKKIVNSPFTAYTVQQVKKHDRIVQRNWQMFKAGQLDINDELRSHYEKFVDKMSFDVDEKVIEEYLPEKPNFELNLSRKEFGSIIENYEESKYGKPNNFKAEDDKITLVDPKANIKAIPEEKRTRSFSKHVTLDVLRRRIQQNPKAATEMSQVILEMENKYMEPAEAKVKPVPDVQESDIVPDAEVTNERYELSLPKIDDRYPLRIYIPKDKRQRNKLYQVKDRFYDHYGFFLYRVPGLFS